MTVSYTGNFGYLLFRWKGSLWKSVWKALVVYIFLYYTINMLIRFVLDEDQIAFIKRLRKYCTEAQTKIPLLFLLGFYVSMIVSRWWVQFNNISWPDRFMIAVVSAVDGRTERDRLYRRIYARWAILMAVLSWREISSRIRKRFPTLKHLVKAGIMTKTELKLYEDTDGTYGKWWLPAIWSAALTRRLEDEGVLILQQAKILIKEIDLYRGGFGTLACYDWVPVPLVYTQVAIIATYGYFAFSLISEQLIPGDDGAMDSYIPILGFLQFVFYQGWLSVGQDFMSPFGEDDDDFEMNWILDRNFFIAMLLADSCDNGLPELEKDIYWDHTSPTVPHTRVSKKVGSNIFPGHLSTFKLSPEEMRHIPDPDVGLDSASELSTGRSPFRHVRHRKRHSDSSQLIEDGHQFDDEDNEDDNQDEDRNCYVTENDRFNMSARSDRSDETVESQEDLKDTAGSKVGAKLTDWLIKHAERMNL